MALPKVLQDILRTVQEHNSLKSWNIFQDKYGMINIKLKYESHIDSVNYVQPVCYRKKTNKESQRDYARSRSWKDKRQPVQTPESVETQTQFVYPVEHVPAESDSLMNISLNPDAPSFMPVQTNTQSDSYAEEDVCDTGSAANKDTVADKSVITVSTKLDNYQGMKTRSMTQNTPETLRTSDLDSPQLIPEPAIMPLLTPEKTMTSSLLEADEFDFDDDSVLSSDTSVISSCKTSAEAMEVHSVDQEIGDEAMPSDQEMLEQIHAILTKAFRGDHDNG